MDIQIADMLEGAAREIENAEGRCSYCVGWWATVVASLARRLRDGEEPGADYLERHTPAAGERHGRRCPWHLPAEGASP
jgi:hypothetical protein